MESVPEFTGILENQQRAIRDIHLNPTDWNRAAVSESLSCELKWPNDLISIQGEKIGGIMIEANSSNPGFRIGIGINSTRRLVNGISCLGWSDTIGDVSLQEVFRMVDSGVSGILERLEIVPILMCVLEISS